MGYSLTFYKDKTGSGVLTLSNFQRFVTIFAFLVVSGAFAYNAVNQHSLWLNGFFLLLTFVACFYKETSVHGIIFILITGIITFQDESTALGKGIIRGL